MRDIIEREISELIDVNIVFFVNKMKNSSTHNHVDWLIEDVCLLRSTE